VPRCRVLGRQLFSNRKRRRRLRQADSAISSFKLALWQEGPIRDSPGENPKVNRMLDRPETSIEYGLIAIGIAIALILVISSLPSWTAP
jgi:hypothetical protein